MGYMMTVESKSGAYCMTAMWAPERVVIVVNVGNMIPQHRIIRSPELAIFRTTLQYVTRVDSHVFHHSLLRWARKLANRAMVRHYRLDLLTLVQH